MLLTEQVTQDVINSTCGHFTEQNTSVWSSLWNNVLIIQPVHGSVHVAQSIGAWCEGLLCPELLP